MNEFFHLCISVDDCPQRFNDGRDPYKSELQIHVLGGAAKLHTSLILISATVFMSLTMKALL